MSKKQGRKIRNKKIAIAIMEYIITLGCLLIAFVMVNGNKIKQESSYAKPEEVRRYEQIDGYVARVRPGTQYETFKEITERCLNREISVYKDAEEMEEVRSGIITSGMVVETEGAGGVYIATEGEKYEVSVVGDLTGDGECNVTELTKIIRSIIGLDELGNRGEELSADFNGDDIVNVVDVTMCIKYIVYGEMEADEEAVEAPEIEIRGEGNEGKGWYRGEVEVEIIEKGEGIAKTQTTVEGNRIQTTTEKEFKLSKEGIYKIKSQSYGTNGTRSEIVTRVIGIDKTKPEMELTREEIDYASCKIIIRAQDNNGIGKYRIEKDGIEERTKEIRAEGEIEEEVTIRENGRYKVIVEDLAGNEEEKEIEIRDLNNRYTVRFKNEDGSIISEKVYEEGEKVEIPGTIPSKEADNTYTYRFIGWTPEVTEETVVVEDIEYTAEYEGIYKNYTVTFRDEDGEVISSKTDYHYGDTVEVPEDPSKEEDNTYTYEFKGWTPELSTEVRGNVEYRAEYESKYKEYEIKFLNEDRSEITSRKYHYGDRIEIIPAPAKEATNEYKYEFKRWKTEEGDTLTEETVVTKEESYIVEYESRYREYTVIFKDEDGEVISSKSNYHYGETIIVPNNPSKEEDETYTYEFKGWSPSLSEEEENIVTKDIEYTATYEAKYKEYTVTFKQDNGEIISRKNYHYGDRLNKIENPKKESTAEYAYIFLGWNPSLSETEEINVTRNLEYTATYEAQKINYNLMFYNYDDELIEIRTYNYGDIISFPRAEREETEEIRYVLDSWENLGSEEISSTEVNIRFRANYREEYYVARVEEDEKSYFSLREAIFSAGNEERTIRLLKDTEESAIVEDKQNITLNLNGHIVTGTKEYTIKTYGKLTVEDNTEAKEGKIIGISKETEGYGIYNKEGEVTVRSGIILAETVEEDGRTYAIYNQSTKPVIIEGGSILANAKGEGAISSGIYNLAGEEVKVEGGLILGNAIGEGSTTYGIYNEDEGKIEVTEGIIEGKASLASAISYGIYNKTSEEVVINGGKIVGQSDKNKAYGIYNEEGKVEIEAGEIEITANIGYGVYNEEGEIENTAGKISMISSTSYGVYNNEGRVNYNGGEIELLGTTTYGIYNNKELSVRGGEISNKTGGSNTYGIYNGSEEEIEIANIKIEEAERGIWNNKGKIEITGVEVRTTEGIYTGGTSEEVVINSGEIITTRNGINNNTGKVIIKDATINSEGYGVFNTGYGITEIGEKGNGLTIEKPQVKGTTYGIYQELNGQGEIRFYDGKIEGRNAIYGGIGEIEENTRIVITEDEEEIATLEVSTTNNVAKIEENYYQTLEGAIEAVEENREETTTIEILRNAQLSETTEVPSNKKVKIDLKGYTIETYAQGGIINKGTLEITDTVGAGVGKIESNIGIAISNKGKLTLEKGTIKSNNYGVYNSNEITVNGGKIESTQYSVYNTSYVSKTEVNSGELHGKYAISEGTIKINGGTITGDVYAIYGNSSQIDVNVNNGNIIGQNTGIYCFSGNITINNGNISSNRTGISITSGNLIVKGGRIEADNGIVQGETYSNAARIDIGVKDGNINLNNPVIIGRKTGIELSIIGGLNYYDGKVGGKEDAANGNILDVETNKEISITTENINNEEYKFLSLIDERVYEDGIAQIGENIYRTVSSLKRAIAEIPENTEEPVTIKILNNFALNQLINIESQQNVIFDLNGKTITSESSIMNKGDMEITDKTESHEGKLVDIKDNAIINRNTGDLKLTSGTVSARNVTIYTYNTKVAIGTKDGNFENDSVNVESEGYGIAGYNSTKKANLYDGKIKVKYPNTSDIDDVEEGYVAYSYQDGEYYITTLQLEAPVASTGGINYYSLQEAIDNCENGEEVIILRDVDLKNTVSIGTEKEIILDLKGYTIKSNKEITLINNGTLDISKSNGSIENNTNGNTVIQNNGNLNLNKGTIRNNTNYSNISGTAIENNRVLKVQGGSISGYTYGVYNNEDGIINLSSGYVNGKDYAIYNKGNNDLNITGGNISTFRGSTTYGIFNDANANINISGGSINSSSYSNNGYSYGIYNNKSGNVLIKGENTKIEAGTNSGYGYGIYNNENGNVKIENGEISTINCMNLAYGIKNTSNGKVELLGGNIIASSNKGQCYGIENGISGKIEMTGGNIKASTIDGVAYGIKNVSIKVLEIKDGNIKAEGIESYGIYNNSSDLRIGEDDGTIKIEGPIVESDKVGIYVYSVDSKYEFYDGKIIGLDATNTEVKIPENKILYIYDQNDSEKEIMVVAQYVATFWNEDKTEIIARIPFRSTDKEIEEPQIPEIDGYIGVWSDYEIGDEDLEIQLYYVEKKENGTRLSTTDKNGLKWSYTYQDGYATKVYWAGGTLGDSINIPSKLDGYKVIELGGNGGYYNIFGFNYNSNNQGAINNISIPNTVETIGNYAFTNCNINSIIIPDSVKTIGNSAFNMCRRLRSVKIGKNVKTIGDACFMSTGLGNVEIPDSVESIGQQAFEESSVTSIKMGSGLKTIKRRAFYHCLGLHRVQFGTGRLRIETEAFAYCYQLESIEMPDGVENIASYAFYYDDRLMGSLTIPNSVQYIGSYAFAKTGLSDIYIKNMSNNITLASTWNQNTRAYIHYQDCTHSVTTEVSKQNLKIETIEGNIENGRIKCGETYRFKVTDENGNINTKETVTVITQGKYTNNNDVSKQLTADENGIYTIENINRNTHIIVNRVNGTTSTDTDENNITWNYTYQDGTAVNVYYVDGELGKTVNIPDTLDGFPVKKIGNNSSYRNIFQGQNYDDSKYKNVEEVVVPQGVTTIGKHAFYYTNNITNIIMPDSITNIEERAFENCNGITEIELPNGLENIGEFAFYYCKNLEEITIPASVKNIEGGVFSRCDQLMNLKVDSESNYYIVNDGVLFTKDLKKIVYYPIVKDEIEYIIPDSVCSIENYSFEGNTKLESIDMPDNLIEIGNSAFSNCTNLLSIEIPNTVTSIGNNAFCYCQNLKTIKIPNGVKTVQWAMLYYCEGLTDIYFDNLYKDITFESQWKDGVNAYVHYSDCKHSIINKLNSEEIELIEVNNNLENNMIKCGESYKFKLNNKLDNENKNIMITSQGRFTNSEYVSEIIYPDENGIYSIEKIDRNIEINLENFKEGKRYIATDENNITWEYTYENGKAINVHYIKGDLGENIEIPSKLDNFDVESLYNDENISVFGRYRYHANNVIKNIDIPSNIKNIGKYAFSNCNKLSNINISSSVEKIDDYAIYNCSELKEIHIPSNVKYIGKSAFYYSNNLTDIYIDNYEEDIYLGEEWNTSGYVHFKECKHELSFEIYTDDNIIIKRIGNSLSNENINCKDSYQFQILDQNNNVLRNQNVLIQLTGTMEYINGYYDRRKIVDNSSAFYANDEEYLMELTPDEYDGTYTIDDVHRNVTIVIGATYQTTDSKGIKWNYNIKDGKAINVYYESGNLESSVEIPSLLDGYQVVSIYNKEKKGNIFQKAENKNEIENIKLPEGLTTIKNSAFYKLKSLNNVEIPNSVTLIEDAVFYKCENLENIDLPNGLTQIGSWAFAACNQLKKINYSNQIEKIGEAAFAECYNIEHIVTTNKLESIEKNTYRECSKLSNIEIPENITEIKDGAFDYCFGLKTVSIPSSVKKIGTAFTLCSGLLDIYIDNYENNVIKTRYDGKLWNYGTSAYIHYKECKHSVIINRYTPCTIEDKSHNLDNNKIDCDESYIFKILDREGNETTNEKVVVTYLSTDNYSQSEKTIEPDNEGLYVIGNINRNIIINIGDKSKVTATDSNGIIWEYTYENGNATNVHWKEGTLGKTVNIPEYLNGHKVVSIYNDLATNIFASYSYSENMNIEYVNIPETVNRIGNSAFFRCKVLKKVNIPNSVTAIEGNTFSDCYKLEEINIPDGVTKIEGGAFRCCYQIKSVDIPDNVTTIGGDAFYYCRSLETVRMSRNVTYIGSAAFASCYNLHTIIIWQNVDELGYRTFGGWSNTQTIFIGNNDIPKTWDKEWDYGCDATIVYGYTGD